MKFCILFCLCVCVCVCVCFLLFYILLFFSWQYYNILLSHCFVAVLHSCIVWLMFCCFVAVLHSCIVWLMFCCFGFTVLTTEYCSLKLQQCTGYHKIVSDIMVYWFSLFCLLDENSGLQYCNRTCSASSSSYTGWTKKVGSKLLFISSPKIDGFLKLRHCYSATLSRKFAIPLKIPPHLKCVATLPREI